jgi:glucokinase
VTLAIGVDVGGTKVLAAAVDTTDPTTILVSHRVPTPTRGPEIAAALVDAARHVLDEVAAKGLGPVAGVGVGLPGLVDLDGMLRAAPNLHGGVGAPIRGPLSDALGLPVVVDNDANCAAWAEVVAGAGRGASHVLLVTLGTGIGGGFVIDGRLHHGAHGFAGEPGHMVVDRAGPLCPCGRHGCWERYASGNGLGRLAREAAARGDAPGLAALAGGDAEAIRGEHVAAAARDADAGALAVFEEFGGWVGLGVANLVNLLDPDLVLVGGGLADVADLFLEHARAAFAGEVMGAADRVPARLEVATLGSDAGAIGAALLAVPAPLPPFAAR